MKKSIILLSISVLVVSMLSSCNQEEINALERELALVEEERDELLDRVEELEEYEEEVYLLRREVANLEGELEVCLYNHEQYVSGRGRCITRYWKGIGRRTICGVDNIIDMYEEGYCIFDCKYNSNY